MKLSLFVSGIAGIMLLACFHPEKVYSQEKFKGVEKKLSGTWILTNIEQVSGEMMAYVMEYEDRLEGHFYLVLEPFGVFRNAINENGEQTDMRVGEWKLTGADSLRLTDEADDTHMGIIKLEKEKIVLSESTDGNLMHYYFDRR